MNCLGAGLVALIACLGNPDPEIRDKIAFARLSAELRGGGVDRGTLLKAQSQLLGLVAAPDPQGFQRPFAILALAEIARTDRLKPWMADGDREQLVDTAAAYLTNITDYRAFTNGEGFRHGVAHGADLVLQLALNSAITKSPLDRLLAAIATQVSPKDSNVAYWAGAGSSRARRPLHRAAPAAFGCGMDGVVRCGDESISACVMGPGLFIRSRHQEAPQHSCLPVERGGHGDAHR